MSRIRGGRLAGRAELGEAISFEDVLTVLTVLLLLRLVFMVPLVNLDKAMRLLLPEIFQMHQHQAAHKIRWW